MSNEILEKLFIHKDSSLIDTLKKIEEGEKKVLFVLGEDQSLFGVLTDGDIRRWILANGDLKGMAQDICNTNPITVSTDYALKDIKQLMIKNNIMAVPVTLDGKVTDVLLWENVFTNGEKGKPKTKIDIPVVIMAGGKGTRLQPFTHVLPKPLIPIGDKTVIEMIIDNFREYSLNEFYITVNHKSKTFKAYFEEREPGYKIEFVEENEPLGTAGSLQFLKDRLHGPIFLSNCDIIIKANYKEILDHHLENLNDITLVASLKHFNIPYGVCDINGGGTLKNIQEKPGYDFLVNTGMYVLESKILDTIPENKYYNMTDLINDVKNEGGKVGVFPIGEQSWIDVGQWEEYRNATKLLSLENDSQ